MNNASATSVNHYNDAKRQVVFLVAKAMQIFEKSASAMELV